MRKILIIFLLFIAYQSVSQSLNNEWIDYTKTYYKFQVGKTGLYRITQQNLPTALQNVAANQFQLWRNGKQVVLYTSVASNPLSNNDYIEFWGEKNDGKVDKNLYRDPAFQISDKISLQTDTAAFFLTVNPLTNNNLRYINEAVTNSLAVEPFFMYTLRYDFKEKINRGFAVNAGENVYSSSYDLGEFWATREIYANSPYLFQANSINSFPASASAALSVGIAGVSATSRRVQFKINSSVVVDKVLYGSSFGQDVSVYDTTFPLALLTTGTNNFSIGIIPDAANSPDFNRIVAAFAELKYPRNFDFAGAKNFAFTLAASQGYNLNITNFTAGAATPILYDITNNKRYVANTTTPTILQFYLPASTTARDLILVSEDASNINTITNLQQRSFINYSNASNQGDYLIISNKILMGGTNPVEQFRQYRISALGGGFNAKTYDIDELVDQFAYGIKKHPLSIKNFIRFANANFIKKPNYLFLIGKGVTYDAYNANESSAFADKLNLVPTWGWPASDNLLVSADLTPVPSIGTGRLSAVGTQEVADYLQKVKDFEMQSRSTTQTIANKAWMKQLMHVVGANDEGLDNLLSFYLKSYETVIRDTLYGGTVTTFNKKTTSEVSTTSAQISNLFVNGISLFSYFGHSAAAALSYNLNDPQDYNNTGKYPMFLVNGCSAGNYFDFDTTRTFIITSLAEKFVSAKDRGAIGFIASTHFGLTSYLDTYSSAFYKSLANVGYGKPVSKNILDGITALKNAGFTDFFNRTHAEQSVLNGDPVVTIYASAKPDFVVEDAQVSVSPTVLSVTDNQFTVKAYLYNIGKATGDSVSVLIKRQYPDGTTQNIFNQKIKSVRYIDSVTLNVPIIASRDKGTNNIIVTIDADNKYDELSELNNTTTKSFTIFDDAVTAVYPLNHAIVTKPILKVVASTANPLSPLRNYVMEMDTTELFNSSFKITKNLSSVGGVLEFDPGITYKDSSVYYWRVAQVPTTGPYIYNNSSFVYLANGSAGFNQSHIYQQTHSTLNKLNIDTLNRRFNFNPNPIKVSVRNAVYPYGSDAEIPYSVAFNDNVNPYIRGASYRATNVTFNVFDSLALRPMLNSYPGENGQYGSLANVASGGREYDFAFASGNANDRKKAMDFMDNIIPTGSYVVVRSMTIEAFGYFFANDFKQDETLYGTGNSLYHRLKNAGFADIDSFNRPRSFVFIYRKGVNGFTPVFKFSVNQFDKLELDAVFNLTQSSGTILSPQFGQAQKWKQLVFAGNRTDAFDVVKLQVLGTKVNATIADTLFTLNDTQTTFDISSISAITYPYLQLFLTVTDTTKLSPYQLRYWRLLYDAVPEGAIAPNIKYSFKDTLDAGENLSIGLAFKNISEVSFSDSIVVKLQVVDKSNNTTTLAATKLKKIAAGDTTLVIANINTQNFTGNNTLLVDVNPNNSQPEQYHFNNFVYKNFFVKGDGIKPILDVTFDGVHILNNDIVAAKPAVRIKLKDESKFLALDDTSLVTVQLRYPDNSLRKYKFNTDTLRFTPANLTTGENVATIDFAPYLLSDGTYELIVTGKDKSSNASGTQEYRVAFTVYNKAAISNVFNYPNPFTTSTAFAFTLTGSVVPQNIKIQVLTVTGKIVREITKDELGPIHIGNNITQFKWDGTDMFGAKLGNGVYLYHVVTNLNGNSLDKFNLQNGSGGKIDTDKYFKAGYGKMYLMR